MTIKELLKANPDLFVIKAKIWTLKRNTIESWGAHDPIIASLVSLLLMRREPHNDAEREAMQKLIEILNPLKGKHDGQEPTDQDYQEEC